MVPAIEYSSSLIMDSREISMTVHFKNNLCHWFPNLPCVSAYRWVSRLTVDGFIISAPRQRGLHSVRPSVVARQHFLVLLPCCPEIILKEVCQPTEVAQWEWREYEPMRDFINIKSDPPRTSRAGPAVGGIWPSCLPLSVAGWEGRGAVVASTASGPRVQMMSLAANQKSLQEARGRRHGAFTRCS